MKAIIRKALAGEMTNRYPSASAFEDDLRLFLADRPTLAETLDAVVAHGLQFTQFNMACAGLPSMPDHLDPDTVALIRQVVDGRLARLGPSNKAPRESSG